MLTPQVHSEELVDMRHPKTRDGAYLFQRPWWCPEAAWRFGYVNERLDSLRIVAGVCQEIELAHSWTSKTRAIANR
jgi:hypothetical protein